MSTETKLLKSLGKHWQKLVGDMDDPPDRPSIADLVETMADASGDFVDAWQAVHGQAMGLVLASYTRLEGKTLAEQQEWLVWLHKEAFPLLYALLNPEHHLPEDGIRVQAYTRLFSRLHEIGVYLHGLGTHSVLTKKHFLAPILKAWLERPKLIVHPHADKDGKPYHQLILPMGEHEYRLVAKEKLVSLPDGVLSMGLLPGFSEYLDQCDLPHPHILLANAVGFAGLTPGKGARLDSRILWWCLTATEYAERVGHGEYRLPYTLQDLIDLLWPSEEGLYRLGIDPTGLGFPEVTSFRPGKHGRGLLSAIDAVHIAKVVFPDGYFFRPIRVEDGHLDVNNRCSMLEFRIKLPPKADRGGAEVGRIPLLAAGTQSDTSFRLEIGLSYLWDDAKRRNRGSRVYDTVPAVLRNEQGYLVDSKGELIEDKGKLTKSWAHPRAVHTGRVETSGQLRSRVRTLDNRGLHRLAYSELTETYGRKSKSLIAHETKRIKGVLDKLEAAGRIAIDKGRQGWRIIQRWQE